MRDGWQETDGVCRSLSVGTRVDSMSRETWKPQERKARQKVMPVLPAVPEVSVVAEERPERISETRFCV